MDWVDILVPGAAILALFGVVALVITTIRMGRHIRRVEEKAALGGGSATEVPMRRLMELQDRIEGKRPRTPGDASSAPSEGRRRVALGVASALILVLAGAGAWYLFIRDDGTGTASASTTTGGTRTTPPKRPVQVASDRVPANPPPLDNKAAYTVAVFNASGITGAARDKVAPQVVAAGYSLGPVDNAQAQNPNQSVVMWAKGKRTAAWNVAKDLDIGKATPLDGGFSATGLGSVDVVVVVGTDLARR